MKINVYTCMTKGSADYADFLYRSMDYFKSGKYDINYYYIESVGLDKKPENWECIGKAGNIGHNSSNHALALNKIVKNVGSGRYNLIIDADTCILRHDWDCVLVYQMNSFEMWGAAYPKNSNFYQNFPSLFFMGFRGNVVKPSSIVNLDFMPDIDSKGSPVRLEIKDKKMSHLYDMPIGSVVKCDTGYKIAAEFRKWDYSSNYMSCVNGIDPTGLPFSCEAQKKICNTKPSHMASWLYKDELFLTHKQASRNHAFDGEWGLIWRDRINGYLMSKYDVKL